MDVEKELRNELKNLPKEYVVSVIVPADNYEETNMHLLKTFINKEGKAGIYITVNRSYEDIVELMKNNNIDTTKISFVDCISKELGKTKDKKNCIFVDSPANLTDMAIAIDNLFKHTKHGFIFFDSLDTLAVYRKMEGVVKFVHFITGKMRIYDIKGILLGLHEDLNEELINETAHFTDKIIRIS